MKLIFFAIILIVAVVSGLIFLFYYLYRKKRFFELRKERRILRDLENGKINASDAEVELSKLKKYRKIAKKEKPLTKAQKRRKLALQIVSMIMVVVVGAVGGFLLEAFMFQANLTQIMIISVKRNTEMMLTLFFLQL